MRLFVAVPLHAGALVPATPAQAHHMGTVMRRAAGESVRLFNGVDGEWQAVYRPEGRGKAVLEVVAQTRVQAPEPDVWLAFAPLKRDATDLVVQKATELGVSAILPVLTRRTIAQRVNLERLAAIATEAAEQCERLTVPRLAEPVSLPALLAGWPVGRVLVAAVERAAAPPIRAQQGAGLLVGPEGGYAPEELELLTRHPFVHTASLGPCVLRAETACIVGLALLQAEGTARAEGPPAN
jgi:16S rRNA (uracil1498-N3)-methyltransferase